MSDFIVDNDLCDTPLKITDPILSTNLDMTSGFFQPCISYSDQSGVKLDLPKARKLTEMNGFPLPSVAEMDTERENTHEVNMTRMRHLSGHSSDNTEIHKPK